MYEGIFNQDLVNFVFQYATALIPVMFATVAVYLTYKLIRSVIS